MSFAGRRRQPQNEAALQRGTRVEAQRWKGASHVKKKRPRRVAAQLGKGKRLERKSEVLKPDYAQHCKPLLSLVLF